MIVRNIKRKQQEHNKNVVLPYLEEYYNVEPFYPITSDVKSNATSRIFNAVMDALNKDNKLPRFLVVLLDKDILSDLKLFDFGLSKNIMAILNWLIHQINITVRRKKCHIRSMKPGALGSDDDPTTIFMDMIQRIGNFQKDSKITAYNDARFKFNSLLHKVVAKQQHKIMSIRSCTSPDHFDACGNLTNKGKIEFWLEADSLLERYNKQGDKITPEVASPAKEE